MPCIIAESIAEEVMSERKKVKKNYSFLILDFDSVLPSSNARYLRNLIVSKNVRNSRTARQCNW